MSDHPTPEQQLGELAARALDGINSRPIVGAVLLLAEPRSKREKHRHEFDFRGRRCGTSGHRNTGTLPRHDIP